MRRQPVLIISADPLAAALLGGAVELAGHLPAFPGAGERARDALRRLRPRLVLVDCEHEEACTESFAGPVLMTGARLLLFRAARAAGHPVALADRMGLSVLEMPAEHERLEDTLRGLLDADEAS